MLMLGNRQRSRLVVATGLHRVMTAHSGRAEIQSLMSLIQAD
jgi:hypothetical protein